MEFRQLGRDGPKVSVIGLGAWPIGGGMGHVEEQRAISIVHAAIDNGITLLDTAQAYRTSEATLGRALKGGYRERCFLATKASRDYSPEGIRAAMEDSVSPRRTTCAAARAGTAHGGASRTTTPWTGRCSGSGPTWPTRALP